MEDQVPLPPPPALPARNVFAVFGYLGGLSAGVEESIKKAWPDQLSMPVSNGWLVADVSELPASVYEKLTSQYGGNLSVLINRFDKYYGWYDKAVWDWIEARQNGRQ
jgi:hypothetical protein